MYSMVVKEPINISAPDVKDAFHINPSDTALMQYVQIISNTVDAIKTRNPFNNIIIYHLLYCACSF
jgi:hypothetical protein